MIFNRKIHNRLLKWKTESDGKKAILIEGARRIGKSTVVETFAKKEYENYLQKALTRNNMRILFSGFLIP